MKIDQSTREELIAEQKSLHKEMLELVNSIIVYTYEIGNYEEVKRCEARLEEIRDRNNEIEKKLSHK